MGTLDEAIAAYQAALDNLPHVAGDGSQAAVMRVLLARDGVAQALGHNASVAPDAADSLLRVNALDQRLRATAPSMYRLAGRGTFARWRETVLPAGSAWWWSLDKRAIVMSRKAHPLWALLTGLFLTASISLTTEIAHRFLSPGADFLGVFSTLSQAFLALLAGSTLTRWGRRALDRLLARLGVEDRRHAYWKAVLALAVLLLVVGLRLALPTVARFYNYQGLALQNPEAVGDATTAARRQPGQITSAIVNYQRAISLNPDYAQAHYNLGTAYEDVLEYDKAMGEYQRAIETDRQFYGTYNNQARLYILQKHDYASALTLLNRALELRPTDPSVLYSLYKNRGWANYALGFLNEAQRDLRQALRYDAAGGAAHCLLAQVLEGAKQSAADEWEACLAYGSGQSVEADWLSRARERLAQPTPFTGGGQK